MGGDCEHVSCLPRYVLRISLLDDNGRRGWLSPPVTQPTSHSSFSTSTQRQCNSSLVPIYIFTDYRVITISSHQMGDLFYKIYADAWWSLLPPNEVPCTADNFQLSQLNLKITKQQAGYIFVDQLLKWARWVSVLSGARRRAPSVIKHYMINVSQSGYVSVFRCVAPAREKQEVSDYFDGRQRGALWYRPIRKRGFP